MKTIEIDYSAPVAILKRKLTDRYRTANIYKVKRYASFFIHYPGNPDAIYCGTPAEVEEYAKANGLSLIPMNARGRKFFTYTINK